MHEIESRYGRFVYDLFRIHQRHVRKLVNPKDARHEERLRWIIDRASIQICHVLETKEGGERK